MHNGIGEQEIGVMKKLGEGFFLTGQV